MSIMEAVEHKYLRKDMPDFSPGDRVRVHVKVVEGNRERTQAFEGYVIRKRGRGTRETFTVRRVSFGIGIERIFPMNSPMISHIEVIRKGLVRRSRLYYLRNLTGKKTRIKEKR